MPYSGQPRRGPVLCGGRKHYHQQYLSESKNPHGYCGLAGTGVACPVGLGVETES